MSFTNYRKHNSPKRVIKIVSLGLYPEWGTKETASLNSAHLKTAVVVLRMMNLLFTKIDFWIVYGI